MTIDRTELLVEAAEEFIAKVDRGEARSKRSYAAFKDGLLAFQTLNPWRNADELLPPKDTLVEVCGHSGMSGNIYFLAYAQHMPDYRPHEPWRGVTLEALHDHGWTPLFWRFPEPLPEMPEYDGYK